MVAVAVKRSLSSRSAFQIRKNNSESFYTREKGIHTDTLASQHRSIPHLRHQYLDLGLWNGANFVKFKHVEVFHKISEPCLVLVILRPRTVLGHLKLHQLPHTWWSDASLLCRGQDKDNEPLGIFIHLRTSNIYFSVPDSKMGYNV